MRAFQSVTPILAAALVWSCASPTAPDDVPRNPSAGLPAGTIAASTVAAACPNISFGGLSWRVSPSTEAGPQTSQGAYSWSCSTANVFSDALGRLHLRLTKTAAGTWQGVQLSTGSYRPGKSISMSVASDLNDLVVNAPSAVLAFFLYGGPSGSNEIDIEISRWTNAVTNPIWYSVYPSAVRYGAGRDASFGAPSDLQQPTQFGFAWTSKAVAFSTSYQTASGPGAYPWTFAPCTCASPYVPRIAMPLLINLWVDGGAIRQMGSRSMYEVVLSSMSVQ